jgi:hypothetical protein
VQVPAPRSETAEPETEQTPALPAVTAKATGSPEPADAEIT